MKTDSERGRETEDVRGANGLTETTLAEVCSLVTDGTHDTPKRVASSDSLIKAKEGWFCGTGCLRLGPNSCAINGWFLFNYLGQDDVVGLIAGRAQGGTMPNLNTGVMASVSVTVPPRKVQDEFARLTFPMAEAREALTAKIENFCRTRDLLLSRLLSGQVKPREEDS